MTHVAANLLAFFVFRTSAVQRSIELRGWGGAEPPSDVDGTPAYPTAAEPSAAEAGQPSEGQPYPWPGMIPPVVPNVKGPGDDSGPCGAPVSVYDMEQPIGNVKPAYGDGYCHFAPAASWLKECNEARQAKDYVTYAKSKGMDYQAQVFPGGSLASPGPPDPLPVLYAGGTRRVVTQLHAWPLEDVYCDAMGWMDTPSSVLSNHTNLELLGRAECKKLFVEHPEFSSTSMKELVTLMNTNHNDILQSMNRRGLGPTVSDMKRHAMSRCLLGGLECDIANCATNFCRRDDLGADFIGHGHLQCGHLKFGD